MGSSTSKAARGLPKEKSSWAGARMPRGPQETQPSRLLAFENKTHVVETDARDPQFMSKLSQLGPVHVDLHVQHVPPAHYLQNVYPSGLHSEAEASPSHSTQTHLLASSLSDLLEMRKTVNSQSELQALAKRCEIDVTRLTGLGQFINTPSIDVNTIVRSFNHDGEETLTMMAHWVDPKLDS